MPKAEKKKKICFTASSGGHFDQLLMLTPMMQSYDSFILTERTKYTVSVPCRTYYLKQLNRKEKAKYLNLLWNAFFSLFVFLKEFPDVVISTGVLATIPICFLAKIFHKKLVYIESFAKVDSGTETGKLIYRFADQFYVQWESMLSVYPNAIYLGGIY